MNRVPIIKRRGLRHHLFQGNGEFIRIKRPPFTNFFSWCDDLIPGFHRYSSIGKRRMR
jgi:hypothetical protein